MGDRSDHRVAPALQPLLGFEQRGFAGRQVAAHAGEGGAMGTEDARVIAPVIAKLAAEGMAIRGPLPADTMFHPRARATYDVAICMYHDQALIPIKTIDFDGGVNVTLGLPFVRTSPDHGTALDIAGKGIANPIGQIWSGALMLSHLGYPQAHDAIVQAIERVLEPASGGPRTPDLGGRAHTVDLGLAIAEAISAR